MNYRECCPRFENHNAGKSWQHSLISHGNMRPFNSCIIAKWLRRSTFRKCPAPPKGTQPKNVAH